MNLPDIPPGTTGRAATPLRPSGKVSVAGATVDARTEGEWFDAGQPVAILRADGFGLVVGRPGTVSLPTMADDRRSSTNAPPDDDGAGPSSWDTYYLEGVLAFTALGTFLGGISLLMLAFSTPPTTLFRLIPRHLGGGAALGLATFHLGLALFAIRRRIRRGRSSGHRPPGRGRS